MASVSKRDISCVGKWLITRLAYAKPSQAKPSQSAN